MASLAKVFLQEVTNALVSLPIGTEQEKLWDELFLPN
jgi:hypothetical protein